MTPPTGGGAFKEHGLDPMVVVEVLHVAQIGHHGGDRSVEIRRTMPGNLGVMGFGYCGVRSQTVYPPRLVTSAWRQSTAPASSMRAKYPRV